MKTITKVYLMLMTLTLIVHAGDINNCIDDDANYDKVFKKTKRVSINSKGMKYSETLFVRGRVVNWNKYDACEERYYLSQLKKKSPVILTVLKK